MMARQNSNTKNNGATQSSKSSEANKKVKKLSSPSKAAISKLRSKPRAVKANLNTKSIGNVPGDDNVPDSSGVSSKNPVDRSQTNFPYDIRVHGFASIFSTVQKATPKVRRLLLEECDLIMECRFCKNFFRSVPNFLSHKQNYCKSMFHPSSENAFSQFVNQSTSNSSSCDVEYTFDTSKIDALCQVKDLYSSTSNPIEHNLAKVDFVKQAVEIADSTSRSSVSFYDDISKQMKQKEVTASNNSRRQVKLVLDPVHGRNDNIMYQTRESTDPSITNSSDNLYDMREIIERDTAILGPDGKVMCTGTAKGIEKIVKHLTAQIDVTQRKMVQESSNQFPEKCDICKTVFNTEKALRQHRRDAPDCVKQSTNKLFNGGSQIGKISGQKRSTEVLNNTDSDGNEDGSLFTPTKRKKIDGDKEESSRTSTFVKKLFAHPGSPAKRSSLTLSQLSSKSPMYVKKTMSNSETKTSPYKKAVGKAVKKLQMSVSDKKSENIKCVSFGQSTELPVSCIRCASRFKNTSEMSMHMSKCTEVINLSSLRKSTPSKSKISIEVRHTYSKENVSNTNINKCERQHKEFSANQSLSLNVSSTKAGSTLDGTSLKQIFDAQEKRASCRKNQSAKHNKIETVVEPYSTANLKLSGKEICDQDSNTNDKIKSTTYVPKDVETIQEINGDNPILHLQPLNNKEDLGNIFATYSTNSSSPTESDVDKESNSNITDSGISSTTNADDEHREGPEDSSVESEEVPSTSSTKRNKSGSKSKKSLNPDDRVLTPKNKNLRFTTASKKRKSFRIQKKNGNTVTKKSDTTVRKTK